MREVKCDIVIKAPPSRILRAFLEETDLKEWWGVARAFTEVSVGGLWTIAWNDSDQRFKYVSSGIIKELELEKQLTISQLVYLNPEKPIMGPLQLEITVVPLNSTSTLLAVNQPGYKVGPDWDWYYESVLEGWPRALKLLKEHLEK